MATLKIGDLSVGDWVEYNGNPYFISSIDESGIVKARNGNGTLPRYLEADIAQFSPRPITVDVLLDNGLVEIDLQAFGRSTTTRRFEHGQLGIVANAEGTFSVFNVGDIGVIDVMYLHELQRAVRVLNLDKEINL